MFRVALRAIKKWARCKGLYSNVLGLVGRHQLRHPRGLCLSKVSFERPRSVRWKSSSGRGGGSGRSSSGAGGAGRDWPQCPSMCRGDGADAIMQRASAPTTRRRVEPAAQAPPRRAASSTWRRSRRAQHHAGPSMNSRCTTSARPSCGPSRRSWRSVHRRRGGSRSSPILTRGRQNSSRAWRRFFRPSDFFEAHRHYVQVDVSADSDDALRRWTAWCESRLRQFVVALDLETPARVHATPLENTTGARKTRIFLRRASRGTDKEGVKFKVDLTPQVREFSARVNCWTLRTEGMDLCLRRHRPRRLAARGADGLRRPSSDEEEEGRSKSIPSRSGPSRRTRHHPHQNGSRGSVRSRRGRYYLTPGASWRARGAEALVSLGASARLACTRSPSGRSGLVGVGARDYTSPCRTSRWRRC